MIRNKIPCGTEAGPVVGIIGGSGIYALEGLKNTVWHDIDTPFGSPSDQLMSGVLDGVQIVFLPRHGRGHNIPPSELNFRANIDAMKQLGVTEVLSVSAVGSLREDLPPGTFVIVDQFIDRTFARIKSFFGAGLVAHVSIADPVCPRLGDALEDAGSKLDIEIIRGGTYLVMEGPQFSSRAESELYRNWGCDLIGMTNMPEAKLAREAELCYSSVAMVTDYDCWHQNHDNVTADVILKTLVGNAEKARTLLNAVIPRLAERSKYCPAGCHTALDNALVTAPEARDPKLVSQLQTIAGRVL
mgnify:FL=1